MEFDYVTSINLTIVVAAATDRADRQTVATRASTTREADISTGVDRHTVVLVLNVCTRDIDTSGGADIEGIRVVTTILTISRRVVDRHVVYLEVGRAVDGEALDRSVLDADVLDDRVRKAVSLETLRLGLATIGPLAVPPLVTAHVDQVAVSALDGNIGDGEGDERAIPLLVAEGGGAFESDGGTVRQVGHV